MSTLPLRRGGADGRLTLIVPTRNRPIFLARVLDWYRRYGCPWEIVVADSSDAEDAARNAAAIATCGGVLRVSRVQYEADVRIHEKMRASVAAAGTPYAVFCADDDFVLPESLARCVEFLDGHTDYAAAQGTSQFSVVVADASQPDGYRREMRFTQDGRDLSEDDAAGRLRSHLLRYRPTFYAVHRREVLAADCTWDDRFGEVLPSCVAVIRGKIRRFDELHELRELHSGQLCRKADDWDDLLVGDDFSLRYRMFRQCLVAELTGADGLSAEAACEAVNAAAKGYFAAVFARFKERAERRAVS